MEDLQFGLGPARQLTRARSRRPATHQRAESQSLVPPRVHEALRAGGRRNRVGLPTAASAAGRRAQERDPDSVLARLLEGNKRFVSGKLAHPGRRPEDFAPLAEGQAPLAIIVGCADSRVSPEVVFDQGVGDLFVVRVAGNVVSGAGPFVKGSVEFAVAELGARADRGAGPRGLRCGQGRGRSTSTPMTLCRASSATSSRSSGRPPQRSGASLVTSSKTLSRPTWRWALTGSRAWTRFSRGWSRRGR